MWEGKKLSQQLVYLFNFPIVDIYVVDYESY